MLFIVRMDGILKFMMSKDADDLERNAVFSLMRLKSTLNE